MEATLESIGVKCQGPAPVGWLTHVYLIKCTDLAFDVFPNSSILYTHFLSLINSKHIIEITLRAKSATFNETVSPSANGEVYASQITIPIPSLANDITSWVYKNAINRFMAIFRDTAGNFYMAGTKNNGMKLTWGRSVQQTHSQQIALTLTNWHPVMWLESIDLNRLFPNKDFDNSFDISFL